MAGKTIAKEEAGQSWYGLFDQPVVVKVKVHAKEDVYGV
jgi:hypothetical protein